jgi:hypothetical protein
MVYQKLKYLRKGNKVMGKLKAGKCLFCGRPVGRHDNKRIMVKVGENNGIDSHALAHLSCKQKEDKV